MARISLMNKLLILFISLLLLKSTFSFRVSTIYSAYDNVILTIDEISPGFLYCMTTDNYTTIENPPNGYETLAIDTPTISNIELESEIWPSTKEDFDLSDETILDFGEVGIICAHFESNTSTQSTQSFTTYLEIRNISYPFLYNTTLESESPEEIVFSISSTKLEGSIYCKLFNADDLYLSQPPTIDFIKQYGDWFDIWDSYDSVMGKIIISLSNEFVDPTHLSLFCHSEAPLDSNLNSWNISLTPYSMPEVIMKKGLIDFSSTIGPLNLATISSHFDPFLNRRFLKLIPDYSMSSSQTFDLTLSCLYDVVDEEDCNVTSGYLSSIPCQDALNISNTVGFSPFQSHSLIPYFKDLDNNSSSMCYFVQYSSDLGVISDIFPLFMSGNSSSYSTPELTSMDLFIPSSSSSNNNSNDDDEWMVIGSFSKDIELVVEEGENRVDCDEFVMFLGFNDDSLEIEEFEDCYLINSTSFLISFLIQDSTIYIDQNISLTINEDMVMLKENHDVRNEISSLKSIPSSILPISTFSLSYSISQDTSLCSPSTSSTTVSFTLNYPSVLDMISLSNSTEDQIEVMWELSYVSTRLINRYGLNVALQYSSRSLSSFQSVSYTNPILSLISQTKVVLDIEVGFMEEVVVSYQEMGFDDDSMIMIDDSIFSGYFIISSTISHSLFNNYAYNQSIPSTISYPYFYDMNETYLSPPINQPTHLYFSPQSNENINNQLLIPPPISCSGPQIDDEEMWFETTSSIDPTILSNSSFLSLFSNLNAIGNEELILFSLNNQTSSFIFSPIFSSSFVERLAPQISFLGGDYRYIGLKNEEEEDGRMVEVDGSWSVDPLDSFYTNNNNNTYSWSCINIIQSSTENDLREDEEQMGNCSSISNWIEYEDSSLLSLPISLLTQNTIYLLSLTISSSFSSLSSTKYHILEVGSNESTSHQLTLSSSPFSWDLFESELELGDMEESLEMKWEIENYVLVDESSNFSFSNSLYSSSSPLSFSHLTSNSISSTINPSSSTSSQAIKSSILNYFRFDLGIVMTPFSSPILSTSFYESSSSSTLFSSSSIMISIPPSLPTLTNCDLSYSSNNLFPITPMYLSFPNISTQSYLISDSYDQYPILLSISYSSLSSTILSKTLLPPSSLIHYFDQNPFFLPNISFSSHVTGLQEGGGGNEEFDFKVDVSSYLTDALGQSSGVCEVSNINIQSRDQMNLWTYSSLLSQYSSRNQHFSTLSLLSSIFLSHDQINSHNCTLISDSYCTSLNRFYVIIFYVF